jgi:hypothetical protein
MENEDYIDNIITNLKIIGLIHVNEKLSIHKGHLYIDKICLQSLKRWYYKDSREIIIIYLRDLIKIIQHLLNKMENKPNYLWILAKIFTEMEHAKSGIINLKTTYSNDQVTVVKLDTILTKFNEITENIKKTLHTIEV